MNALGYGEERRVVGNDNRPLGSDPQGVAQRYQRVQDFGHAASVSSAVHVQHADASKIVSQLCKLVRPSGDMRSKYRRASVDGCSMISINWSDLGRAVGFCGVLRKTVVQPRSGTGCMTGRGSAKPDCQFMVIPVRCAVHVHAVQVGTRLRRSMGTRFLFPSNGNGTLDRLGEGPLTAGKGGSRCSHKRNVSVGFSAEETETPAGWPWIIRR